jgi:hypothetical protein
MPASTFPPSASTATPTPTAQYACPLTVPGSIVEPHAIPGGTALDFTVAAGGDVRSVRARVGELAIYLIAVLADQPDTRTTALGDRPAPVRHAPAALTAEVTPLEHGARLAITVANAELVVDLRDALDLLVEAMRDGACPTWRPR